VDDKNDNEEGRAPLEYLPRGPRFSSYATVLAIVLLLLKLTLIVDSLLFEITRGLYTSRLTRLIIKRYKSSSRSK